MFTYPYPRPAVTVDSVIISPENNILLIKRLHEPFANTWALPGGFVNIDEELEDACKRELFEETGIKVGEMRQFKAYGGINRDPRHRTISVVFYAFIEQEIVPTAGDDAAKAKWFNLSELPALAFDHGLIIDDFLNEINF